MRLSIDIPDSELPYLEASARLRHISHTSLARKVLHTVLKDQLVLSILDDADEIVQAKPLTHVQQVRIQEREAKAEAQKQRAANVAHRKTQYNPAMVFRKAQPKTREELRRELEQAVVNTAALPVE